MREEAKNALKALARLPVRHSWDDDHVIYQLDGEFITAGHVRDANVALFLDDGICEDTARMMIVTEEKFRR